MRSHTLPTLLPLAIFLLSSSVCAEESSTHRNPKIKARQEQSTYVGGWPLALAASQSSGCPAYAPVEVQNKYTTLECCPTGQIAFVDPTNLYQYCCPDNHDCEAAVRDFPACANATWNMFDYGGGSSYFCCEPGQTATTGGGYGLCEPAGVAVPSNMIGATAPQDTIAATAAASSSSSSSSAAAAAAASTTSSSVVTAQTTSTALVVVSTDTKVSETTMTATLGSSSGAVVVAPTGTGTGPKFSSSAVGGNSTVVVPSLRPSVTATRMTTVAASPSSASAPGVASASPSAKTGGGGGRSGNAGGAVGAVGAAVLMVGLLVV